MKLADLAKDIQLLGQAAQLPSNLSALEITGLTEDSRAVKPGFLFAALPGVKADGLTFAAQAVRNGAVAILASAGATSQDFGVPIIRADNPRQAL